MRQEDFQASKSSQLACGERLETSNKASACELDCISWEEDALACYFVYFVSGSLAMSLFLIKENTMAPGEQTVSNGIGGQCSESCWGFPPGPREQARIRGEMLFGSPITSSCSGDKL